MNFLVGFRSSVQLRRFSIFVLSFYTLGALGIRSTALGDSVPPTESTSDKSVNQKFVYRPQLPPPPEGVAELSLTELLTASKNASGVDYSARAWELNGKMVRVNGYMVSQSTPIPWAILLSPVPQTAHEREYFLCDDLPISTIHVFFPKSAQPLIPFHPEMVAIIGRLELGGRTEADGRTSMARIFVKPGQQEPVVSITNLVRIPLSAPHVQSAGTNSPASTALLKP